MNYVVVDLEWNQAMSSKSSVFNKLPIHLGGEIIEIGAVKLTEDMEPGEEFTIDVKPVYFRRMHYKVKKITGFDKERLSHGHSFPDAMEQFRTWCGDDVTFITWGCDDQRIMEQNIIIHDLDWDWIALLTMPSATHTTRRWSPPGSIWRRASVCTTRPLTSSPRACRTTSRLLKTTDPTPSAMNALTVFRARPKPLRMSVCVLSPARYAGRRRMPSNGSIRATNAI